LGAGGKKKYSVAKVPRQCPFVLLEKVGLKRRQSDEKWRKKKS
jgi:hypothetical protein